VLVDAIQKNVFNCLHNTYCAADSAKYRRVGLGLRVCCCCKHARVAERRNSRLSAVVVQGVSNRDSSPVARSSRYYCRRAAAFGCAAVAGRCTHSRRLSVQLRGVEDTRSECRCTLQFSAASRQNQLMDRMKSPFLLTVPLARQISFPIF